jgi:hypothetical protein
VPGLEEIRAFLGLHQQFLPRKAKDPAYAAVVGHILGDMQALRQAPPLQRLLYLGNRQSRDQSTLQHFRETLGLPMRSFLCEEDLGAKRRVDRLRDDLLANRWNALPDLIRETQRSQFPMDAETAVVVDMDKTIMAARGRNSTPLNRSRVEGVKLTVQSLLGDRFEEARFNAVYTALNRARYHFFTEDNQDYVAYVALMASALVYPLNDLVEDLAIGRLDDFGEFLRITDERLAGHPLKELRSVYQEVSTHYGRGDPTVFKSFRQRQLESTAARIDHLPDAANEATLLQEEIMIAREVLDITRHLKGRGCLLLLITDRPDESLFPSEALAAQGHRPIHRTSMKVHGSSLRDALAKL